MEVEEAATDTEGTTEEAVMVMAVLLTDAGEAHGSEELITTLTWSALASVVEV